MSAADFTLQIGKVSQVLNLRTDTVLKKVAFDLHADITKRTPVDTGRARASWNLSIGQPDDTVPPEMVKTKKTKSTPPPPPAPDKLNAGNILKDQTYITSNLHYMPFLEGGSSTQAPAGMVRLAVLTIVAELETVVAQAVAQHPVP